MLKKSILFFVYIIISLVIGEFHPFSRYQMYDSFPLSATSFFLSKPDGKIIPLQEYFNYKTADISHNYATIKAIKKDIGEEGIGDILMQQLLTYRKEGLYFDTIVLNKINFVSSGQKFIQRASILSRYTEK